MHVGEIIHRLRKEQKMTLSELSEKSGVALATLSRIENGRMTGTLESHMKICDSFQISLPELYRDLSGPKNTPFVQKPSERTEIFVHTKKTVSEMLTPKVLDKKMMPLLIKLEPNGITHKEENKKGVEKFLFVLSGRIEITIGEKTYTLNKNDTLYFNSSVSHSMKNISNSEARIICVISPPTL